MKENKLPNKMTIKSKQWLTPFSKVSGEFDDRNTRSHLAIIKTNKPKISGDLTLQ